jgi:hypothetical protein
MTKVDKKMASSDTIIVSSPNGYSSIPRAIHRLNQRRWIYTNFIEPANRVIWSETRFSLFLLRSRTCWSSAGLTGCGCVVLTGFSVCSAPGVNRARGRVGN